MPRTLDGVIAWARSEASTGRVLSNWSGWCEKFINNAGAFNQAFSSATIAGNAAGYKNPDASKAPPGAIHYYYGAGGFGHDAFEIGGGGSLLLMASSSVDDNWGHNIGTISWSRYQARVGLPYRGWSFFHGSETLAGLSGTAGGDRESIDNTPVPPKDEDLMIRIQSTNRGIALVGAGYYRGLASNEEVEQSGPLITGHYTGNDRQFDLWVSMAHGGSGSRTYSEGDINARIAELAAKIDTIEGAGFTDAQIASIVEALRVGLQFPNEFIAEDRNV